MNLRQYAENLYPGRPDIQDAFCYGVNYSIDEPTTTTSPFRVGDLDAAFKNGFRNRVAQTILKEQRELDADKTIEDIAREIIEAVNLPYAAANYAAYDALVEKAVVDYNLRAPDKQELLSQIEQIKNHN